MKPGDVLPEAGCVSAQPPERPPASAAVTGDEDELVFVARYFDLGYDTAEDGSPSYERLGYDLDGVCSRQEDDQSCLKPPWQVVPIADQRQGRDVSANELLYEAASLPVSPEQRPFASLERDADMGRGSISLRVRGYNGKLNDAQVDVAAFSVTMWPSQEGGPRPGWNGDDVWHAGSPWVERSENGALAGDDSRFHDPDAYVANGVFVARFPTWQVGFVYIPYGIMHDVVMTGRLVAGEMGFSVRDGVIAGRWPINNLLNAIAREESSVPGETVCNGSELYNLVRTLFCNKVDLSLTSNDGSQPCDAVSTAFGFSASAATLGEPVDIPAVFYPDCGALDCSDELLPLPE